MIDLNCKNCKTISVFDESQLNCPECGSCFHDHSTAFHEEFNDLKTHVEVLQHMYTEYTQHVEKQLKSLTNELKKMNEQLAEYLEQSVECDGEPQVH